jgi:class 3 adenylate cyclase
MKAMLSASAGNPADLLRCACGDVHVPVHDIEGSTALLRRLGEDHYGQVLARHHELIRSGLAAHDGTEVDNQGDAFFAVFSSPRAGVAAVMDIQRALQTQLWPAGERVRVRMGVHTGEAAKTATGLVGLDVHRAARLAAVGHGGQALFSESAATLVRDSLPPGTALTDLGVHRLKDLGRPEHIFQLDVADLQAGFPPLRSLGNPVLPNFSTGPETASGWWNWPRSCGAVRGYGCSPPAVSRLASAARASSGCRRCRFPDDKTRAPRLLNPVMRSRCSSTGRGPRGPAFPLTRRLSR